MRQDKFEAFKNLNDAELLDLISKSSNKAVRRLHDERNGDFWFWRSELATHAEGAEILQIPYNKRPGEGDILTT